METFYKVSGVSRQNFHARKQPSGQQQQCPSVEKVLELAHSVRENYLPGAAARVIYGYIGQHLPDYQKALKGCGKHAFEAICLQNGMRVVSRRFIPKTTHRGDYVFDNLIAGMGIWDIDCIWVCDISYVFGAKGNLIGYATSLLDAYSRRLLGLTFSPTMHAAVTSNEVLRQAMECRKISTSDGLIFHTDGGKQFIEKNFLTTLRNAKISSSMADHCLENAFAEAFNDTLKNHMLHDLYLNSFPQLKEKEIFLKNAYNFNKPHSGIKNMTPVAFEQHILNLKPCQRTKLIIKELN